MAGQHQSTIYTEQGGDVMVVESGGAIDVQRGGNIGRICGATCTVGAEAANVINVAIQLTDAQGNDLDEVGTVFAFLSDASTGIGISGTAPVTSVAIGTDGAIIKEHTTKLAWTLQSEADGDIDLDITETGADTWYLVIVLPDGTSVVSDAITFAA